MISIKSIAFYVVANTAEKNYCFNSRQCNYWLIQFPYIFSKIINFEINWDIALMNDILEVEYFFYCVLKEI